MITQKQLWGSLISLGLFLGINTSVKAADVPANQAQQFQKIEQPLGLKAGVTLVGLGLISLELWWFLFSKTKAKKAEYNHNLQEITINVNGGYEPDRIVVQAGKPVKLNFIRQDPNSCLAQVLLPDFRIAADLPINQLTSVEFTPDKPGNYPFNCGMNMFRGVVEVQ